MPRLITDIISDVRQATENSEFSDDTGIQDAEFVRFLNDAQNRLHRQIVKKHRKVFHADKTYDVQRGDEQLTLPNDCLMENAVAIVEFSSTGDPDDYEKLDIVDASLRNSDPGYPCGYFRRSGKVFLVPTCDRSGKVRITYIQKLPRVAKRAGTVSVATLSGTTISALTLDTADTLDVTELTKFRKFTVVSDLGVIKAKNISFDSIDESTGVVSITSGFALESGETIAVGDYVIPGAYASSHPQLPDEVEEYLLAYCSWKILKRDSSADYSEQQEELIAMEEDLVDSYSSISDDIETVPIIANHDWWE